MSRVSSSFFLSLREPKFKSGLILFFHNNLKNKKKGAQHMISMKLSSHPEANMKHQGLIKLNFSGVVTVIFQWRND